MARPNLALVAALAVTIAVAIGLAGCGSMGSGGTFVVEHQRAVGPLPIVLTDTTGRLLSLAAGEQVEGRDRFGIDRAEGLLPTVELRWVGLACDERVAVTLDPSDERLRLEVKVVTPATCRDVTVSRSVLLTFAGGVRAEDFDVIVPAGGGRQQR